MKPPSLGDFTGPKRGSGLVPGDMYHLGGDEVNTACYESTPDVAAWLKAQDPPLDGNGGYEYFVKKAHTIARSKGRDTVGWEEIWNHFGTDLPLSTIIHQVSSTAASTFSTAAYPAFPTAARACSTAADNLSQWLPGSTIGINATR